MGNFASKPDHVPTPKDIFTVRGYLLAYVPAELANVILEEAHYWPKVSYRGTPGRGDWIVRAASSRGYDAYFCCLVSPRLKEWIITNGAPSSKVKAVRFTIVSHDQGWATEDDFEGKYEGSWTWFETAIVRNFRQDILDQGLIDLDDQIADALGARGGDADSPVTTVINSHSSSWTDTWHVQSNVRADNQAVQHTIVWTEKVEDDIDEEVLYAETGSKSGRGFVRSLEMGDRIAIIARAKYPGWENHIEKIDLEVYYSV